MNKFDPEVMKQLLYQLDSTMDRILAASNYACDFINMAPEIAKIWNSCFSTASADQQLPYLYFTNDVFQKTRRAPVDYFVPYLESAFVKTVQSNYKILSSVEKLLNVWDERHVLPSDMVQKLRRAINECDSQSSSGRYSDRYGGYSDYRDGSRYSKGSSDYNRSYSDSRYSSNYGSYSQYSSSEKRDSRYGQDRYRSEDRYRSDSRGSSSYYDSRYRRDYRDDDYRRDYRDDDYRRDYRDDYHKDYRDDYRCDYRDDYHRDYRDEYRRDDYHRDYRDDNYRRDSHRDRDRSRSPDSYRRQNSSQSNNSDYLSKRPKLSPSSSYTTSLPESSSTHYPPLLKSQSQSSYNTQTSLLPVPNQEPKEEEDSDANEYIEPSSFNTNQRYHYDIIINKQISRLGSTCVEEKQFLKDLQENARHIPHWCMDKAVFDSERKEIETRSNTNTTLQKSAMILSQYYNELSFNHTKKSLLLAVLKCLRDQQEEQLKTCATTLDTYHQLQKGFQELTIPNDVLRKRVLPQEGLKSQTSLSKEAIESLKLSILEREKEEAEKKQAKLEEEAKIEALKRQQDLAINLHSLQEIAGVTWNSKQAVESLIDREKDN